MTPAESEVVAANQAFYDAFANGNLVVLDALWASEAQVACVHPGREALHGREAVIASWRAILSNAPPIRCTRASATVLGDTAYVICCEEIEGAKLCATNLFVRERGAWKIVLHQASPIQRRTAVQTRRSDLN